MTEEQFLAQFRTAVAYHGLSLGTKQEAHGTESNQVQGLWYCGGLDCLQTTTFSEILAHSFLYSNEHLSRIQEMAIFILSFPDGNTKRKLLEKIADENEREVIENEYGYFLPLSLLFYEAEKRFAGAGKGRLLWNPSGILLNNGKAIARGFMRYGDVVLDVYLLLMLLALSPIPIALGFLDSNAKNSYIKLHQIDQAQQASLQELNSETNQPLQEVLSPYQHWMFESFASLGKDITKVMYHFRKDCTSRNYRSNDMTRFHENHPKIRLLLARILTNLTAYLAEYPLEQSAVQAFFCMPLAWDPQHKTIAPDFFCLIADSPPLATQFLELIYNFESQYQWLLLRRCMDYPLAFLSALSPLFEILLNKNSAESILSALTESSVEPSLDAVNRWVQLFPRVVKQKIVFEFLTSSSDTVLTWLEKQQHPKKILRRWMAISLAFKPETTGKLQASVVAPSNMEYTLSNEEVVAIITGDKLSLYQANWNLLYQRAMVSKNKERIIEYINALSSPERVHAYLEINDKTTTLGAFFNCPRKGGKPKPNAGSRVRVPEYLGEAQQECVTLFHREHGAQLAPRINTLLEKKMGWQQYLPSTTTVSQPTDAMEHHNSFTHV